MVMYLKYAVGNYRFRRKKLGQSRRESAREVRNSVTLFRREAKRLPQTDRYEEHCRATIGMSGACLGSMSGYRERYPDHVVEKNRVLVKDGKMFWYGDIDFTVSYGKLMALAERIGPFEVHSESWSWGPDHRKGMKPERVIYGYD